MRLDTTVNVVDSWRRCLAVAVMLGGLLTGAPVPVAAQEVGVAARVNGTEISLFRLERHFEDYLKAQGRNVGAIRNPSVFKRLKREALDQLIDKQLLWEEAVRRGIEVDEAEVDAARAVTAKAYRSPEAFAARLAEAGFDEAGYGRYLKQEIAANRALAELVGTIEVSDADAHLALERNRARFERPEQVRARHILLRHVPAGQGADRAPARILELQQALRDGADFAALARKHSEDSTAGQGGDLGYFGRGRMVPAFEQAAFALPPGAVSEPVRTEFGWHLIKVEEKLPASAIPEDEALDIVRRQIHAERHAEAARAALQKLRSEAKIVILSRL